MRSHLLTYFTSCLLVLSYGYIYPQLSPPQVQGVYGGRILSVAQIPVAADSSRVFVTTESANSAFYTDIYHPSSGTPVASRFTVVPGLDGVAGFGNSIRNIAAHANSGNLYFVSQGSLYTTDPSSASSILLDSMGIESLLIYENILLYIQGTSLHFGTLNSKGEFTADPASPVLLPPLSGPPILAIHPISEQVYVCSESMNPVIYHSTESISTITASTGFVDVSPTSIAGVVRWSSFGIGPDGRRFCAGSDFASKYIAYSDDDAAWTYYQTGFGGAAGSNLAFGGDSSAYHVYYASIYNDDRGNIGHWNGFGNGGQDSHPNDGVVSANPSDPNLVFMTTDVGLGMSDDGGSHISDINEGIEAVQVNDFDMTSDKQTAWIASKSGIRKVSDYLSTPTWTQPIFPMGDGSPYSAAAMSPVDTNTVYAGNLRVYKTSDGGHQWQRLFSAEDPPYNFPHAGNLSTGAASITALEVCQYDPSIVFAGYEIAWGGHGGLFYSMDAGGTWDQILIHETSIGQDTDVNDIIFHMEEGDTIAYIGVGYDLDSPAGRSMYRLVKQGNTWNLSQDMNADGTSTGSLIVATIRDLAKSPTGDTLLAIGTDAGVNHPIAYYKPLNTSGLWTPFTTSGFPFGSGIEGKAITVGVDTIYAAVGNEVYYFPVGASNWTLGYAYPVGTRIQFLYFDELLVGTETGLYGHQGLASSTTSIWKLDEKPSLNMTLFPNPARTEAIQLSFPNPEAEAYTLMIHLASGQEIYRKVGIRSDEYVLDRSIFKEPGMYIIQIQGGKVNYSGKLIIE